MIALRISINSLEGTVIYWHISEKSQKHVTHLTSAKKFDNFYLHALYGKLISNLIYSQSYDSI